VNIIEAMHDPALFGKQFAGDSWAPWRTLLAGFYGITDSVDVEQWTSLTGRTNAPTAPHNELWLPMGRRGGKSQIAALLAVFESIFNDHASRLSPGEVATVMIIAADRRQARTVMRYVRGLFSESPMLERMVFRNRDESIELTNRCVIEVQTATHRGTRGYTVAAAICDEIAYWLCEGASPDAEIISALRPSMATLGGKLICLSSPYSRKGVLWGAYKRHYGINGRILVAQAPSLTMNPTLDPDIVRQAFAEDPISASAEYGAQFRTDVEGYCSMEVLAACTRPSQLEIMPDSITRYSAFCDPSGGSADSMTLAIAHYDKKAACGVVDATRTVKPPFSPEAVVEEFCELLNSHRIREVTGDAYAGEWPREQFRKRGISYRKSDRNKSEIYRDLLPLLNSQKVELPPDPQLERELLGLERRTSRGGRDTIDHRPGAHDDLANSVAGALVNVALGQINCLPTFTKVAGL
jgi:hypothetical protein